MSRYTRALISVADKTGIETIANSLIKKGIEILSTGGTAAALRAAGIRVTDVSDVTGFPEIMDGRVKTLHPKIHGGLLGRRDIDAGTMQTHGIEPIDLLIVNLYPFEATIAKPDCTHEDAIENIDIGGPAMIRAAAKNHHFVAVVVDPGDYDSVIEELDGPDVALSDTTRQRLAKKAFGHTAAYDAALWNYLDGKNHFPCRCANTAICAMAKIHTSEPHSIACRTLPPEPSFRRTCTRANRSLITTWPTPMPHSNASRNYLPAHA